MDVIKDMAKNFSLQTRSKALNLEAYDSALNSKLIYINKDKEKLRFLSYLRDYIESMYQQHLKKCPNPEACVQNKSYEIAIYSINQQYDDYNKLIGGIDLIEKPAMMYFSDGQYFDAFSAIRECIKEVTKAIVLIDGYVDDKTLAFFSGKEPSISLKIITKKKSINNGFERAVELYNKQYENLSVFNSEEFHDRFLILDDSLFYHIGASIKDAGNKIFMFSKIEDYEIIEVIRKKISSIIN